MPASIKDPLILFQENYKELIVHGGYLSSLFKIGTILNSMVCIQKIFQDETDVTMTSHSLTPKADGSLPVRLTSDTEYLTAAFHVKSQEK